MSTNATRRGLLATVLALGIGLPLAAQHGEPAHGEPAKGHGEPPRAPVQAAAPAGETKPAAEQKRGAPPAPTHAPQPELPPATALQFVRASHAAVLAARTAARPLPQPAERPAGAGRYVCAVVTCADADFDVPTLLGLATRDVLLVRTPAALVSAEVTALLEQQATDERLSLVIVLGHTPCSSQAMRPGVSRAQDALAARIAHQRRLAEQNRVPFGRSLLQQQVEALRSASPVLEALCRDDRLRLVAAEVDGRSGELTWHTRTSDELPLAPVR